MKGRDKLAVSSLADTHGISRRTTMGDVTDEHLISETVSRDELVGELDSESRRRRGVPFKELLASFEAGDLAAPGGVADLLITAELLPPDDPIRAQPRQPAPR
jgi:hypothetical protein